MTTIPVSTANLVELMRATLVFSIQKPKDGGWPFRYVVYWDHEKDAAMLSVVESDDRLAPYDDVLATRAAFADLDVCTAAVTRIRDIGQAAAEHFRVVKRLLGPSADDRAEELRSAILQTQAQGFNPALSKAQYDALLQAQYNAMRKPGVALGPLMQPGTGGQLANIPDDGRMDLPQLTVRLP